DLFQATGATRPGACMDLWRLLAKNFPAHATELDAMLTALRQTAPQAAKPSEERLPWPAGYFADELGGDETAGDMRSAIAPKTLVEFLATVQSALSETKSIEFLDALAINPVVFAPETLLLPCLEHAHASALSPAITIHLWTQCAAFYLDRSAAPPAEPRDWVQALSIAGSSRDPLLRELERFARNPEAREHRFSASAEKRAVLHRAIERARLDMTHVTERKGRPYTLVCTKTRATYERACARYRSDLTDMRRLLSLPIARNKNMKVASATAALHKAIGEA
ncbi:MAG: hypothetical protein ACREIA_02495, partial [Opitutaceae bacterium]